MSSTETTATSDSQLASVELQIRRYLTRVQEESGVPGIGVALSVSGTPVDVALGTLAAGTDHPMSLSARFQIGCVTKLLTAVVMTKLVNSGEVDPESPLERYLEEFHGTDIGRYVTVRHLLSHTSGYQGPNLSDPKVAYGLSWPELVTDLISARQLFEPGTVFSYEHSEYVVLGEILERITASATYDLFGQTIFKPMRIQPGRVREDQQQSDVCVVDHVRQGPRAEYKQLKALPFGSLWKSSLSDITLSLADLRLLGECISGFSSPGASAGGIVSDEGRAFLQERAIDLPATVGGKMAEQLPESFGMGCAMYAGGVWGHNGSARGQTCALRFDPYTRAVLAVGMNAWHPYLRDTVINNIFGLLRGRCLERRVPEHFSTSFEELAGCYVGPGGAEVVVSPIDRNTLHCDARISGAPRGFVIVLTRSDDGTLRVGSDALHHSIGFFRSATGISGLMLSLAAMRKNSLG